MHVKQAETHGMSQRGGDVVSHLRISNQPIYSDLIAKGKADLIIAVEPMEALRYVPYLSKCGHLVTNINPYKNIPNYPDIKQIISELRKVHNVIMLDADKMAANLQSKKSSNMIMLGASAPFLYGIEFSTLEDGIREIFGRKGDEVVQLNLKALQEGRDICREQTK